MWCFHILLIDLPPVSTISIIWFRNTYNMIYFHFIYRRGKEFYTFLDLQYKQYYCGYGIYGIIFDCNIVLAVNIVHYF